MNNILDNELVKKYFNCNSCKETEGQTDWHRAFKILDAMQQPLRKGERYLLIDYEIICEKVADSNSLYHDKHLGARGLPVCGPQI